MPTPTDRLRYSPGSLVIVVSASTADRDAFLDRLIEDRASLLSLGKVRALLAGRVAEETSRRVRGAPHRRGVQAP